MNRRRNPVEIPYIYGIERFRGIKTDKEKGCAVAVWF
jgi:hypothetical protein